MEELARTLRHKTQILAMDVTLESAMEQFAEVLAISNPKITVLVNCAGAGEHGRYSAAQRTEELPQLYREPYQARPGR